MFRPISGHRQVYNWSLKRTEEEHNTVDARAKPHVVETQKTANRNFPTVKTRKLTVAGEVIKTGADVITCHACLVFM
jgi:hypothetical protein